MATPKTPKMQPIDLSTITFTTQEILADLRYPS
jgi:hypothetical protein